VKQPAALWRLRARGLEEARRSVRRAAPDALRDLRVALLGVAASAAALRQKRVARPARALAHSLARPRRLEVDQRLLARVGRLGLLSPDSVTALAARWEKLAERAARRIARATDGRKMQRLRWRLARLARKGSGSGIRRLAASRREAEEAVARPLEGRDDGALRRCRRGVRTARFLAADLVALGLPEPTDAARESALQESLDRWNDLRAFRRRLALALDEAQGQGAIVLAGELRRLLALLEPAVAAAREAALAASRRSARVVPLRRATRARA
jgi:hypothetical protein